MYVDNGRVQLSNSVDKCAAPSRSNEENLCVLQLSIISNKFPSSTKATSIPWLQTVTAFPNSDQNSPTTRQIDQVCQSLNEKTDCVLA